MSFVLRYILFYAFKTLSREEDPRKIRKVLFSGFWAMSTPCTWVSPPAPILHISYHGIRSACLSMCQPLSQELSECPTFGGHSEEDLSMALGSGPACAPGQLAPGRGSGRFGLCPVGREKATSADLGSSRAVLPAAAVDHFPSEGESQVGALGACADEEREVEGSSARPGAVWIFQSYICSLGPDAPFPARMSHCSSGSSRGYLHKACGPMYDHIAALKGHPRWCGSVERTSA